MLNAIYIFRSLDADKEVTFIHNL